MGSTTYTRRAGWAVLVLAALSASALAQPRPYRTGLPHAATPVMDRLVQLDHDLLVISAGLALLVALALVWVILRGKARKQPSAPGHHGLMQFAWAVLPMLVIGFVAFKAIPLFRSQTDIPKADITIEAIGRQWYWTYVYPQEGGMQFDSNMLSEADAKDRGELKLLGVDNPLYVPVNTVVEVIVTGSDVIHSWSVPAFGIKAAAIPGRLNRVWFKATRLGTFYGQCSELCGANHAFMPIEVKVVSEEDYQIWLELAKTQYASGRTLQMAAQ